VVTIGSSLAALDDAAAVDDGFDEGVASTGRGEALLQAATRARSASAPKRAGEAGTGDQPTDDELEIRSMPLGRPAGARGA
jgi:hypothetical protein